MISKIRKTINGWKTKFKRYQLSKLSTQQLFSKIYKEKLWGTSPNDNPFYSGPGTSNPNTEVYIAQLSDFIKKNKILSILDVGCGDFSIMREVTNQNSTVEFIGLDVVPELIAYNQEHYSNENVKFICGNAVTEPDLPNVQLVTIRQVLQHLSNAQISGILAKLKNYNHILITEHLPLNESGIVYNVDKIQGDHIRLAYNSGVYIDKEPFNIKATILFEYREDLGEIPAIIRTYHISNFQ
jgi:2-polyprenyl-3-methyl-5-hydroxy-6-metoxy-1,4-benzoquinol methylase